MCIFKYTYICFQQSCCHVSCAHKDSCYGDILTETAAKKQCNVKNIHTIWWSGKTKIKIPESVCGLASTSNLKSEQHLKNRFKYNTSFPHWSREHDLHSQQKGNVWEPQKEFSSHWRRVVVHLFSFIYLSGSGIVHHWSWVKKNIHQEYLFAVYWAHLASSPSPHLRLLPNFETGVLFFAPHEEFLFFCFNPIRCLNWCAVHWTNAPFQRRPLCCVSVCIKCLACLERFVILLQF